MPVSIELLNTIKKGIFNQRTTILLNVVRYMEMKSICAKYPRLKNTSSLNMCQILENPNIKQQIAGTYIVKHCQ